MTLHVWSEGMSRLPVEHEVQYEVELEQAPQEPSQVVQVEPLAIVPKGHCE